MTYHKHSLSVLSQSPPMFISFTQQYGCYGLPAIPPDKAAIRTYVGPCQNQETGPLVVKYFGNVTVTSFHLSRHKDGGAPAYDLFFKNHLLHWVNV